MVSKAPFEFVVMLIICLQMARSFLRQSLPEAYFETWGFLLFCCVHFIRKFHVERHTYFTIPFLIVYWNKPIVFWWLMCFESMRRLKLNLLIKSCDFQMPDKFWTKTRTKVNYLANPWQRKPLQNNSGITAFKKLFEKQNFSLNSSIQYFIFTNTGFPKPTSSLC